MSSKGRIRAGSLALVAGAILCAAFTGYTSSPSDSETRQAAAALHASDAALARMGADDGAELYMTRCMSCHQMNGRGVPGVFPPLSNSEWVTGDKGTLIRIVLNGMTGEMKVGDEVYSGAMPPWQTFLDDKQTADLLTYIRSSWENDTTAVTPAEVAAVRKAVADRKQPWTAEELKQEANQGIPK